MLLSAIWDKDGLEALNIVLCNSFGVRQIGQLFCDVHGKAGIWGNFEHCSHGAAFVCVFQQHP